MLMNPHRGAADAPVFLSSSYLEPTVQAALTGTQRSSNIWAETLRTSRARDSRSLADVPLEHAAHIRPPLYQNRDKPEKFLGF